MKKNKIVINISLIFAIVIVVIVVVFLNKKNRTYAIGDTLVDVVISQSKGDAWNAGDSGVYYTNNHEYRYVGSNVNNYVSFNDDLYRIIGVFDSNSHGQDGKMLVKLIRTRIIGSYTWGVYDVGAVSNDWEGGNTGSKPNLNILLNEYFYNKTDTSNIYGNCSTWTYYTSSENGRTNDCSNVVGYGIKSGLQNYIEEVTWYLYGYNGDLSKQNFYLCERGDYSGCIGANLGAYATSVNAKIGLMYVSDYMYASGYYGSTNSTPNSFYYYGSKNWLYSGPEWTIVPAANNDTYVSIIGLYGCVMPQLSGLTNGVRPTFYLKSSVYVTGGTGTFDDPYTISCDDCN